MYVYIHAHMRTHDYAQEGKLCTLARANMRPNKPTCTQKYIDVQDKCTRAGLCNTRNDIRCK